MSRVTAISESAALTTIAVDSVEILVKTKPGQKVTNNPDGSVPISKTYTAKNKLEGYLQTAGGPYVPTPDPVVPPPPALPPAPLGVGGAAGDKAAQIFWKPVDGAVGYTVYQNGAKALVDTGTIATITGLTNGIAYQFSVSATNAAGEGPKSAIVTITPVGTIIEQPKVVPVSNIPDLLRFLDDNSVDQIIPADGRYHVSPAHFQAADSLWIGEKFAGRTRPIIIGKADGTGSYILDGGGAIGGVLSFNGGAHDQTWLGFSGDNVVVPDSGCLVFGGYGLAPTHHITLRRLGILRGVVGNTDHQSHSIYFSQDGAHDITIEDYTCTPGAQIQSALQFTHDPNVSYLTVRRMHVDGTQNTILLYAPSMHDVLIEDSDIKNARDCALNVYQCGANVILRNVTSAASHGIYYVPGGSYAGLSLVNCNFQ